MILDAVIVLLTGSIAVAATWMAVGLLRRQPERVDNLVAVGFRSPVWPTAFGVVLLTAVAGLIIGWWFSVVGIAAIVAIKIVYVVGLLAYRRAGLRRDHDRASRLLTAHSVVSLVALMLLLVS